MCGNAADDPAMHDVATDWLAELFAYEYCAECGGDAEHHTAVPFMGNPFARCDYPSADDVTQHPIIAAFRAADDGPRTTLAGEDA